MPFRGNVDTRLKKLRDGIALATLLAVAGLKRLGRDGEITAYLDPRVFRPAPAQGAIGIEARQDDTRTIDIVRPLDHAPTATAVTAERALLRELDGSCRTAIGVFTEREGGRIVLHGEILAPDGSSSVEATEAGDAAAAAAVGTTLGQSSNVAGRLCAVQS